MHYEIMNYEIMKFCPKDTEQVMSSRSDAHAVVLRVAYFEQTALIPVWRKYKYKYKYRIYL